MRLAYIAYPTSLVLKSANAIQTHTTLRELRRLAPDTLAIVPRWLGEPSRFTDVGALHLPRPAIGKLSRLYKSTLLYYAERSVFAAMTAAAVALAGWRGQAIDAVYVREALCAGWWAAVWGPLLGIPVIYEAHDLESWNPSRAKERWAQPLINLLDRLAITRSAAVVSLTAEFRQLLARLGWRDPADVAVIPDAFDAQQFQPGDQLAARQALGITGAAPVLVYAGMTFSYRGLNRLLDALPTIQAQIPGTRIILVGGRPAEIAALQQQAAALNLSEYVTCTGPQPQEQVLPYLHAADLLVIPDTVTDVTASPLKLFEYLATARAVVLPAIPALGEILPPAVGYYFARGNTTDLARVVVNALLDPDRPARAQAGWEHVQAYDYHARALRILSVADAVLAARHVGTHPVGSGAAPLQREREKV